MNTKAECANGDTRENAQQRGKYLPIVSASTKAQTGNCVSQTSMTTMLKTNISTGNIINTFSRLA
jgi:hypothetical protein